MLEVLKGVGEMFDYSYVVSDFTKEDRPLAYVNQAFCDLTQYDQDFIVGKNCRFLQGEETDKLTVRQISECLRQGESGWFDILNYKKNGEKFWNRLTLIPIGGDLDPIRFYLGIQQDVTDLKDSKKSFQNYGPLKASDGKNLIEPLTKILNNSRALKYFNESSQEIDQKLHEFVLNSKAEVAKIAQFVRNLG